MATHSDTANANRTAVYTVVFTVDLTEVNDLAFPPVNENQTAATLAATRSTFIPVGHSAGAGNFHHGPGTQGYKVKHGDTITAYDEEAYYLKANYVKSASNPHGILTIVSESA